MSESIKITRDDDGCFNLESDHGVIEKMGADEALHAATRWALQLAMPYGGWRSKEHRRRQAAANLSRCIDNWLESEKEGHPFPFENVEEFWREFAPFISTTKEEGAQKP